MTDEIKPDAKTLDIASLLAGNEHPTDTVDVYMNEAIGYAIYKARQDIKAATEQKDDEAKAKAEKELDELIKAGESVRLTIHLQGINRGLRKGMIRKALEKYPPENDFLGRLVQNSERDEFHANLNWSAHVVKMIHPSGAEAGAPTPEEAGNFRDKAPGSAVEAVENAIETLTEGAKSGFETLAQEHGFLSSASLKA